METMKSTARGSNRYGMPEMGYIRTTCLSTTATINVTQVSPGGYMGTGRCPPKESPQGLQFSTRLSIDDGFPHDSVLQRQDRFMNGRRHGKCAGKSRGVSVYLTVHVATIHPGSA